MLNLLISAPLAIEPAKTRVLGRLDEETDGEVGEAEEQQEAEDVGEGGDEYWEGQRVFQFSRSWPVGVEGQAGSPVVIMAEAGIRGWGLDWAGSLDPSLRSG